MTAAEGISSVSIPAARGMTSPVREMTAAARAMALGDYSQLVRATSRGGTVRHIRTTWILIVISAVTCAAAQREPAEVEERRVEAAQRRNVETAVVG